MKLSPVKPRLPKAKVAVPKPLTDKAAARAQAKEARLGYQDRAPTERARVFGPRLPKRPAESMSEGERITQETAGARNWQTDGRGVIRQAGPAGKKMAALSGLRAVEERIREELRRNPNAEGAKAASDLASGFMRTEEAARLGMVELRDNAPELLKRWKNRFEVVSQNEGQFTHLARKAAAAGRLSEAQHWMDASWKRKNGVKGWEVNAARAQEAKKGEDASFLQAQAKWAKDVEDAPDETSSVINPMTGAPDAIRGARREAYDARERALEMEPRIEKATRSSGKLTQGPVTPALWKKMRSSRNNSFEDLYKSDVEGERVHTGRAGVSLQTVDRMDQMSRLSGAERKARQKANPAAPPSDKTGRGLPYGITPKDLADVDRGVRGVKAEDRRDLPLFGQDDAVWEKTWQGRRGGRYNMPPGGKRRQDFDLLRLLATGGGQQALMGMAKQGGRLPSRVQQMVDILLEQEPALPDQGGLPLFRR